MNKPRKRTHYGQRNLDLYSRSIPLCATGRRGRDDCQKTRQIILVLVCRDFHDRFPDRFHRHVALHARRQSYDPVIIS